MNDTAHDMSTATILIVDDEKSIRDTMRMTLEYEGYRVEEADGGLAALEAIRRAAPDAVILDIKMQGMDGLETLDRIRESDPSIPVIILTGHGAIETAVEATRRGAFDFLAKPPDRERILVTLRNAFTQRALAAENARMREEISGAERFVGQSPLIRALFQTIDRVAPTEAFVLITGENGSGKELAARALHRKSARSAKALVEVNCAAIPTDLIESELFGHERGSFTGATAQRIGKFEQASGGTILLDEVGDMSLAAQAKVLRVLEEGSFERVGGTKLIRVDVRVIAATNKNLSQEIRTGRFREDLYHRLNVIPLNVPPLRDRRDDIPLLAEYFLGEMCRKNNLPPRRLEPDAVELLTALPWPGNVRELRNAIERLVILVPGSINAAHVRRFTSSEAAESDGLLSSPITFQEFKDRSEALFIQKQLERNQWNVSRTAEQLDIQRSHLYTKMKKYGLEKDETDAGEKDEG